MESEEDKFIRIERERKQKSKPPKQLIRFWAKQHARKHNKQYHESLTWTKGVINVGYLTWYSRGTMQAMI